MFKRLFVFVEGPDDERFCRAVAEPFLGKDFHEIKYITYAKKKTVDVVKFLKSIPHISGAEFIFLHDLDENPCITICKKKILEKFSLALDQSKLAIANKEIESWYLAGVSKENGKKFKIKYVKDTEKINKEKFNTLIPPSFGRTNFMIELLKLFSVEEAKVRNGSFKYFAEKYVSK